MAQKDWFHILEAPEALAIQTIASDTTTNGEDIKVYEGTSITFIMSVGVVTAGDVTPLIDEADDDGTGSPGAYTAVVDADLLGTEAGAKLDTSNTVAKLGYRGTKGFVRLSAVTDNSADLTVGAVVLRARLRHSPKATQVL